MRLTTTLAVITAGFSTLTIAQTERELGSHEHGSAFLNIAVDNNAVFIELETPWDNLVGFEHAPGTDEQHQLVDNAMALLNQPEQLFSFDGGGCVADDATVESSMASGDDDHDDHHDEDGHGDDHDKHDDDHHDEDAHGDDHDKHDDDHHDEDAHGDEHDKHDDDHHDEDAHGDDHDKHDDHHDEDAHGDDHDKHEDDHHDGDAHGDHDDHDDHADEGTHAEVLATYTFNCSEVNQLSAINVTLLKLWSGFEDLDVQLIGPGGQAAVELGQSESTVDISQVQ